MLGFSLFPNSPGFPLLPSQNAAKKRRSPRSFSPLPNFSSGRNSHLAASKFFPIRRKFPSRAQSPTAQAGEARGGRRGHAWAAGGGGSAPRTAPPAPPQPLRPFKVFPSFLKIVFFLHTRPKPLQSHSTAVFSQEIIIVRFQVSKSRRFPKGSRAAEKSKINVHVFSSSGGLRRGGPRVPACRAAAELNPERIFKSRFPSRPSSARHTMFSPSCFQFKLFKFEII